jgi:tRNA pseudouridine38-40 synthase
VISGELPAETDLRRLALSINGLCGPDISVRDAVWTDSSFSARFSATARTYRYQVWNHWGPHPLLARTTWHVPLALDVAAMNLAAVSLLGENDFSSFCRRPRPGVGFEEPSLVRHLRAAEWSCGADDQWGPSLLSFEITASSFCHQIVRSIVGTLVDVGLGRRSAGSILATL